MKLKRTRQYILLTYKMAFHATDTVDDSSNNTIVQVLAKHERNLKIWNMYNKAVLANEKKKAERKVCQVMLTDERKINLGMSCWKNMHGVKVRGR